MRAVFDTRMLPDDPLQLALCLSPPLLAVFCGVPDFHNVAGCPEMNRQELFDTAFRGLAAQGFEQSRNNRGCAYRDGYGRKCAIGHCIPDELYKPSMDKGETYIVGKKSVQRAVGVQRTDLGFASELQICHDTSFFPGDMRNRLEAFAVEHNLNIPEVAL